MVWLILIGVVVVVVWVFSSSGSKAGVEKVAAIAAVLGTEDAFRRYLNYFNDRLVGDPLSREREDHLVNTFMPRHRETMNMMLTVTANNHKVLMPMIVKRGDQMDMDVTEQLGPKAAQKWRSMSEKDRATFGKGFAETQLGLKL